MLKFELEKKIDYVEEMVFLGEFKEVLTSVLYIVEAVESRKKITKKEFEEIWNQILQYIILSLDNKDYLLSSDILKYELKPILNNLFEEN